MEMGEMEWLLYKVIEKIGGWNKKWNFEAI